MANARFAIVQWEDRFTSIICLESVKSPRKPVSQYVEGEYITAPYGKKLYKARISEICEDKTYLMKKVKDGQFPLLFTFEEDPEELEDQSCTQTDLDQLEADTEKQTSIPGKLTIPQAALSESSSYGVSTPLTSPSPPLSPVIAQSTPLTSPSPPLSPVIAQSTPLTSPSPPLSPAIAHSSKRKMEQDIKDLKSSLKALKKRVKELEKCPNKSNSNSPTTSMSENEDEVLMRTVSHLSGTNEKDINSIIKRLSVKLFSCYELTSCTRTGKKTPKTGEAPKPPLNEEKLQLLERIVLTKCPSITTDVFKKKFDNILKMQRRAVAKPKSALNSDGH